MANAISHTLDMQASQREALALRARAHVEAHFSLERMCGSTLEVYAALLEGRAPQIDD